MWSVVPRLTGVAAPLTASGLVMLWCCVTIVVWFIEHKRVRPFAKLQAAEVPATRTASLRPRPQTLPAGRLTFAGPMLIVVAMHFLLWTRQYTLPPETYRAALALLLSAYAGSALFMWAAWLILFRTRHIHASGSIAEEENADKRFGYGLHLIFAYELTAFMVASFLPVARIAPARVAPWLGVIAMSVMSILTAIILILLMKRRRSPRGIQEQGNGDTTAAACWKYGFIYYNPDDPAFVVGTRLGPYGCDFNFANKWSWVVSFGLVTIPILIRFVWF
jgi:hypothetical protein